MRQWPRIALLLILLSVLLLSCTAERQGTGVNLDQIERPDGVELIRADVKRMERTGENEGVDGLVAGNNQFAFNLYHTLAAGSQENLICSPYSISQSFSMVYGGARGKTAEQMANVLHLLPQEAQHPAFNAIDQQLAALDEKTDGREETDDNAFRLRIANAVWVQEGYMLRDAYLELLARQYGAGLWQTDFIEEGEAAKEAINQWTAQATEGRIETLAPPLRLTPNTRLVLANAIYFKASWLYRFDEETTQDGPFTLLDGSTVTVPLMHGKPRAPYYKAADFQAVRLPYWGNTVEMIVILPAAGQWQAVQERLDAELAAAVREQAEAHDVTLTMPRFEFDTTVRLREEMQEMGLTLPFSGEADFSGMVEGGGLTIGDAVHKATITVDEEGTEAAAVTGIEMEVMAYPESEIVVDRPFLFMIVERESGAILFLGQVLNPAG